MKRDKLSLEGRTQISRKFRPWIRALLIGGVLATATWVAGCGESDEPTEQAPAPAVVEQWPELDPAASVATIDANLNVDPPSVPLSKSRREFMQWKNDSGEDLTITFNGAAVGMTLPAGRVSYIHPVNPDAEVGSYPYQLTKPNGSHSPGTPDVSVGP